MGLKVDRLRNLCFRQYSFEKKLQDIEAEMSGRNRSFLPYITDSNGEYSEERIVSFIAANVDCLDEYGAANNMWKEPGFRSVLSPHMPDALRECLESFMYLAVKAVLTENYLVYDEIIDRPVPTFEQVYRLAAELGSGDMRYDDIFTEYYCGGIQRANLLAYCDPLYEILSGKSIKSLITDEMLDRANKLYEKDAYRIDGSYQEIDDLPEELRAELEEWRDSAYSADDEELLEVMGAGDGISSDSSEYDDIRDSFENSQLFCTEYRRFREAYFSDELPNSVDFADIVKTMLNVYLCSKNASSYGSEDTFSDSYIYMKRAQRMVSSAAKLHVEGGVDD